MQAYNNTTCEESATMANSSSPDVTFGDELSRSVKVKPLSCHSVSPAEITKKNGSSNHSFVKLSFSRIDIKYLI